MTLIDHQPTIEVPAPTFTPFDGLFSVVPAQPMPSPHHEVGVWWRSVACGAVAVTQEACTVDSEVTPLDPNVVCQVNGSIAFTVYARSDESIGGGDLDEKFQAAREQLLAGEQAAVEATLWGVLATQTTPVAADSYSDAVGEAERLLAASYGGRGLLHMDRRTAMNAHAVIERDGGRLASLLGTPVVSGGGYGTTRGLVIATGPLVIFRSEIIDLGRHYDQDVNSIDGLVERRYVIGWDCIAVAARFDPEG